MRIIFGGGLLLPNLSVAYTRQWSDIPSGITPVHRTTSTLVVTIRSISDFVVEVMRVGSAITFCKLKSSKSLSKLFVLDVIKVEPGLFWASNMQQFKSPRTKILSVFNQAFSRTP